MVYHNLKDSSQFVDLQPHMHVRDKIMASLDVESISTNVPLNEVIGIIFHYAVENNIKVDVPLIDLGKK